MSSVRSNLWYSVNYPVGSWLHDADPRANQPWIAFLRILYRGSGDGRWSHISGVVSTQRAKGEECTLRCLGRGVKARNDTGLGSDAIRMEGVGHQTDWVIGWWRCA